MTQQHTLTSPFRWQTLDNGLDVLDLCKELESGTPAPAEFTLPPPTPDRDYKIPVETDEQFKKYVTHLQFHRAPEKCLEDLPPEYVVPELGVKYADLLPYIAVLPVEEHVAMSGYLVRANSFQPLDEDIDIAFWQWGWMRPYFMRIGRVLPHSVKEYLDNPHMRYPVHSLCAALSVYVTRPNEYYALDRYPIGRPADDSWREELAGRLRAHLDRDSATFVEIVDTLRQGKYGLHPSLVAHAEWVKMEAEGTTNDTAEVRGDKPEATNGEPMAREGFYPTRLVVTAEQGALLVDLGDGAKPKRILMTPLGTSETARIYTILLELVRHHDCGGVAPNELLRTVYGEITDDVWKRFCKDMRNLKQKLGVTDLIPQLPRRMERCGPEHKKLRLNVKTVSAPKVPKETKQTYASPHARQYNDNDPALACEDPGLKALMDNE